MERYAASVGCRHRHLAEVFRRRLRARQLRRLRLLPRRARDRGGASRRGAADPRALRASDSGSALHVANVLRGHASEQVIAKAHDRPSTFGGAAALRIPKSAATSSSSRPLGLLRGPGMIRRRAGSDGERTGAAEGRDELSRVDARQAARRAQGRATDTVARRSQSWEDVDRALFERLRAVRLETARPAWRAPSVIFHDATLRRASRLGPISRRAPLGQGIGARKADDLGPIFPSAIREHPS